MTLHDYALNPTLHTRETLLSLNNWICIANLFYGARVPNHEMHVAICARELGVEIHPYMSTHMRKPNSEFLIC